MPWWRLNVFRSLLLARLGDERGATDAQDQALAELPASLPRFATRLELHRGHLHQDRNAGDLPAYGCNTRQEVLLAEAVVVYPEIGPGCTLTGGVWWSYYDDREGFSESAAGGEGVRTMQHARGVMVGWMPQEISRVRARRRGPRRRRVPDLPGLRHAFGLALAAAFRNAGFTVETRGDEWLLVVNPDHQPEL